MTASRDEACGRSSRSGVHAGDGEAGAHPGDEVPSGAGARAIRSVMPPPGVQLRAALLVVAAVLAGRALPAQTRATQTRATYTRATYTRATTAPRAGQEARLDSAARAHALRVARDIMRVARYGALVTRDASTGTAARTIDPAPPDSLMVVRFVTNPRSRKVSQLAADPRVALYYFDATTQRYATLYGRARAVTDASDKARHWYEPWTPFYPERQRNAVMYEVIPERLEVVSPGEGILGDPVSWAPPTVHFLPPRRPR